MTQPPPDLTRDVYIRRAGDFDRQRAKHLFERKWLERFAAQLAPGASVLDLGCGSGEPIARFLIEQGYDLTGADFAPSMLDIAAARFPEHRWIEADIRTLALGMRFDGVIAWHSLFHLTAKDQRAALPRIIDHLAPGGVLMFTLGPPDGGETHGWVAGEQIYHACLSHAAYRDILEENGVEVLELCNEDPECDGTSILLARRSSGPTQR